MPNQRLKTIESFYQLLVLLTSNSAVLKAENLTKRNTFWCFKVYQGQTVLKMVVNKKHWVVWKSAFDPKNDSLSNDNKD